MKKVLFSFLILTFSTLLVGCSASSRTQVPVEPLCGISQTKAHAMQVAEEVLTDMRFEIDKLDTEEGVIITQPLRGGQFFEFWRSDNATAQAAANSNLHSLLRQATLTFNETASGLCVDASVQTQRMVIADKPIAGMARLPRYYTGGDARLQELSVSEAQAEWEEMGHDPALASDILDRIQNKILELEGKE
ncbi:hypothetical protein STSP2_02416 [Anaerohalosphaera lusitana]|uniref:Uncharacterized protein n=1 Tax=Anaerohalosphaera lusitana TaxID=1936003 RepID=A0A1U9NN47_9BACT|nr:hypothetical protein [Anaerohalosphaera lusitana]AQT69227.1 hypothetical protein STSP2_02416 [Anaerohalosphaera lusitana]